MVRMEVAVRTQAFEGERLGGGGDQLTRRISLRSTGTIRVSPGRLSART